MEKESKEKILMNPHTGSVAPEADWICESRAEGWDYEEAGLIQVRKTAAGDWAEVPYYCGQNSGDCLTCSLASYGRDCRNNPIS